MQIQDATITRLAVHRVGNATRGEPLVLSGQATEIDEAVSGLLLEGYLKGIGTVCHRQGHAARRPGGDGV